MMREKIDQTELQPCVWLIEASRGKLFDILPILLDIEPADAVFSLDLAKKADDSRFSEELGELVETLKNKESRPDFKQTVDLLATETKCSKGVVEKLNSIYGKVKDGRLTKA
jgi:hypothetical protein